MPEKVIAEECEDSAEDSEIQYIMQNLIYITRK